MNVINRLSRLSENIPSKLQHLFYRTSHTYVERNVDLDFEIHKSLNTNYDLSPILVSHGLFSNKKEWMKPCQELNMRTDRKVICFDAVNHGCSPPQPSMSYGELAHDLHQNLKLLNVRKKVIHLGHRMGGKAAGTLALVTPEKVSHLIIIDSAPCVRSECLLGDTTALLKLVLEVDISTLESKEDVRERMEALPLTPLLLELIMNNVAPKAGGGFKLTCNLQNVMRNYNELIDFPHWKGNTYDGPTLFIGDCNRESDDIASVKNHFPNAQFLHVADIDYNIHLDFPETILSAVTDFVNTETDKSDMKTEF